MNRGVLLVVMLAVMSGIPDVMEARAQPAPVASRVQSVRTFGGPTRFVAPVRTIDALKRSMSRPAIARDLALVLEGAGLNALHGVVVRVLSDGAVTETTLPTGASIEWMALRSGGRPGLIRNVRWDGRPAAGYEFIIDNLSETYTFFVPEVCGNLSLLSREPSREAARRADVARVAAEDARREDEVRMAEARRAEEARAAEAERAANEARAAEERLAAEARLADDARREAETRQSEELRQRELANQAQTVREARLRPFATVLFGKQQRQYDDTDPAGIGRLVNPVKAFGDALVGVKGGIGVRLSESVFFNPAVGLALNVEEGSRTTAFADAEVTYAFPLGAYLGTGVTLWDFTRRDILTLGWLGTGGVRLWRNESRGQELFFAAEWRQLFDRMSDPDVNYQFWGGVKYVFR